MRKDFIELYFRVCFNNLSFSPRNNYLKKSELPYGFFALFLFGRRD